MEETFKSVAQQRQSKDEPIQFKAKRQGKADREARTAKSGNASSVMEKQNALRAEAAKRKKEEAAKKRAEKEAQNEAKDGQEGEPSKGKAALDRV